MTAAYCLASNVPQLFFDDSLIGKQNRLVRRFLPAKIYPDPVIKPDKSWEGRSLTLYGTVLPDWHGGYRLYYSTFGVGQKFPVCLAVSDDGFSWSKPVLGNIEYEGSTQNNIVLLPESRIDSPSLFFDPEAQRPYKMVGFRSPKYLPRWNETWGIHAYESADGLNWQHTQDLPIVGVGDRNCLMAGKCQGKYVLYTRAREGHRFWDECGGRHVCRFESDDFLNWSEPELVLRPDLSDEPDIEFYGMMVFKRHDWYIGLLECWNGAKDVIEVHLAFSKDGRVWQRPLKREPFIAATYPWNATWNSCASNGPIIINEQMVFYFGGRWVSHHYDSAQQHGVIGYASLALDRFCGLEATTGGTMTTVPIVWPGGELALNADPRESFDSHPCFGDGEIMVELLDAKGNELEGFAGDNAAKFVSNTHCRGAINEQIVNWPNDAKMACLKGQTLQLRFKLKHARLFSFEARDRA